MFDSLKNRFAGFTKPMVFDILGSKPGGTLLVTAGMDGDEYAGIAAAYEVVKRYKHRQFAGRLVVIPMVNVAGFENETSWNPQDHKYPKFILEGNSRGTASEQLIDWVNQTYGFGADAWVDLHGGNVTEEMQPFAWFHETAEGELNALAQAAISKLSGMVVYERPTPYRAQLLAKHRCLYVLTEAGHQGTVREADVQRHLRWVEVVLQTMGMVPTQKDTAQTKATVYRSVTIIYAPDFGLWYPAATGSTVKKGEVIGHIQAYDGTQKQNIIAAASGIILWKKVGLRVGKRDMLLAIAA